jgi:hypothetical protein
VAVRGKVWEEIFGALEKVKPDVGSTISFSKWILKTDCIAGRLNDRKGTWSL